MNSNHFGKFLVEECERIDMKEVLRSAKQKLKKAMINLELEANGLNVTLTTSLTGNGGMRYWFACPITGARCATLFRHPVTGQLGSREAFHLKYKKSAKKGMIELEAIDV
jgi:hypothetical protein